MKAIIFVSLTLCLFVSNLEAQHRSCRGPRSPPPPPPADKNPPPPPPPANNAGDASSNNPKPGRSLTGGNTTGTGQGLGNVSGGPQSITITNNPTLNVQNYYGSNSTKA